MTTPIGQARISVPEALAVSHRAHGGPDGERWIAGLPKLTERFLDTWRLRPAGPPTHGVVALVLPVCQEDGSAAVLKVQPVDAETADEPVALRAWDGDGAVRILAHDAATGTMLLERLDTDRSLATVADDLVALQALTELLARLVAVPAPPGLRQLADTAAALVTRTPNALPRLADPTARRLLETCAATVGELASEAGDRLLHWDLHYDNVLAPLPGHARGERWLAIDPKPLAGDPGFELLPALLNRWPEVVASGDVAGAVRRRFDLMTDVLALDRQRARGWTLARVLQNALWDLEDGAGELDPAQVAVVEALDRR